MKRKNDFRSVMVLSRNDSTKGFYEENCHWRNAKTEKEALMGIEEWLPDEPLHLPLSNEHHKMLKKIPRSKHRTFHIWRRMIWRAEMSKELGLI